MIDLFTQYFLLFNLIIQGEKKKKTKEKKISADFYQSAVWEEICKKKIDGERKRNRNSRLKTSTKVHLSKEKSIMILLIDLAKLSCEIQWAKGINSYTTAKKSSL